MKKDTWLESAIEPKESSVKSMVVQSEDATRRNFYLTLFRLYAAIPIQDCLTSFTKIFNDVYAFFNMFVNNDKVYQIYAPLIIAVFILVA